MPEGIHTYNGLGVPLFGEAEIKQQTAATDILTLTGATSMSGDFIVLQNSTGGEIFVIGSAGNIDLAVASSTATNYGVKLALSASAVAAAVVEYESGVGGVTTTFLQVNGSLAPSYLLSVGATAAGIGAATDNGLFEAAIKFLSAPSTAITYGAVKMLAGSKVYYVLAIPDTSMVVT
jgi:hypothetical protein